ncbi:MULTISPECIES: hypothetical protein [unclassified Variovorax]|uniref:hypothetical protein n=1 Tax=unclassified Variovorax TaxID=663243 RepID=UPI003F49106F
MTIDVVSFDPVRDQYALHLVESEDLPDHVDDRRARLKAIQDRVFSAVDAAIDGHLAEKYPETLGQTVRVQVDSPSGRNDEIELVVSRVADYLSTDPEYVTATKKSTYVRAVHVLTSHQLGRFQP